MSFLETFPAGPRTVIPSRVCVCPQAGGQLPPSGAWPPGSGFPPWLPAQRRDRTRSRRCSALGHLGGSVSCPGARGPPTLDPLLPSAGAPTASATALHLPQGRPAERRPRAGQGDGSGDPDACILRGGGPRTSGYASHSAVRVQRGQRAGPGWEGQRRREVGGCRRAGRGRSRCPGMGSCLPP